MADETRLSKMASTLSDEHLPSDTLLEGSDRGCGGDSFQFYKVSEVAEVQLNGKLLTVTPFQTSPQLTERSYRLPSLSCLRPPNKCRFVVERG